MNKRINLRDLLMPMVVGLGLWFVPSIGQALTDEVPGANQATPIALVGGTIHTVSGDVIDAGTVVFDDGVIIAVGTDVDVPANAEVIDVSGQHVYPSLIESYSQVGISEIGSVRETQDYAEMGDFNPNVRTHVAVNPDSDVIPVTRTNGVLVALAAPSSGVISGKSAVLQLDGWTFEDLTLDAETALHVNWPRMTPRTSRFRRQSPEEQNEQRDRQLDELREYFADARTYRDAHAARPDLHPIDVKMESMIPVLAREIPIYVSADSLAQIESAVAFAVAQELDLIIYGGFDAPLCADLLLEHNVPVIVSQVYRRPMRSDDNYDAAYTLPSRLAEAGITFCISGSDTSNARNLPYHAATAVAYGLEMEQGLRAITLSAAEILGIDDQVGSLEVGKHATLFVADGNPMETTTAISDAFIQGRRVDLSSKHVRLYEKYSEKYRRLREGE